MCHTYDSGEFVPWKPAVLTITWFHDCIIKVKVNIWFSGMPAASAQILNSPFQGERDTEFS